MRITCVIHSLCGGGAERLMAGLASRMAEWHEVTLITLDDVANDRYTTDPKVRRVGLSLMGDSRTVWQALKNNVRRVIRLRRAIAQTDPGVVLSFCDKTNVLTLAATRLSRTPVIVSEHTDPRHQPIGPLWNGLRRWLYPRCAAAIALTDGAAEQVSRWTRRPTAVIPPAVHLAAANLPERNPPSDNCARVPNRVLCLGRLSPEKGFDRGIEAFARVAADIPGWNLCIGGEGPERAALQSRIDRLDLGDRAALVGWVEDVPQFLRGGDVFLLTSLYEGFPVGLLEAMSCGLSCVAVDCESGPAEVIRSFENGILVPQNDPEALAVALRVACGDAGLRERMGRGAASAAARFGWQPVVSAHLRLLEQHARG